MFQKCKCPDKIRCKVEFGYHTLYNPTVVPLFDKDHVKKNELKREIKATKKARAMIEKHDCPGCLKTKRMEKIITVGFKYSTKEIQICNLCYKVFYPIFSEVAKVLKSLEASELEIR